MIKRARAALLSKRITREEFADVMLDWAYIDVENGEWVLWVPVGGGGTTVPIPVGRVPQRHG